MPKITFSDNSIVGITCAECGIMFYINKDYYDILKKVQKSFYCPNGHKLLCPKIEGEN